ncbi:MAG TPA: hypothetical protein VFS07_09440 [Gemmatimonadales bacterium]|nr:hypothetical protein [Gemmatimonadales bacterium]
MLTVERWTGEDAAWDAAVAADADGTFCHLAGWREVMAGSLGHEPLAWVARAADGRVAGLLPAVAVRSLLFGRYLVSMPFLNAGGPLGAPEARILLAETAVAEARARAVRLLELRTRGASPPGLVVSRRKITHVLPLPPDAEALWRGFPPKLRSQVRRPQKEGLEARTGPAEREAFYEVFARHMRALGTPVLPATWFDAIARHLAPQVVFVAVYRGAEPVAGGADSAGGTPARSPGPARSARRAGRRPTCCCTGR